MSWRDDATPEVQNDMDSLASASIDFAKGQLARHGTFYPFAMGVSDALCKRVS
jgi:hypothetical protein